MRKRMFHCFIITGSILLSSSLFAAGTTSGPATKLAFTNVSSMAVGTNITPAVTIKVQDANGVTVNTASNMITVSIAYDPNGGTAQLTGTLTLQAVNGVATFGDLKIGATGVGYMLKATSPTLTDGTSNAFNIFGAAAKLGFIVQPSLTAQGGNINPSVQVAVQDANGITVSSANTSIMVSLNPNTYNGTLVGLSTKSTVNGIATFGGLSIGNGGVAYTLKATPVNGNFPAIISAPFDVYENAAGLAFKVQPSFTAPGVSINPAVKVSVLDKNGVVVPTGTYSVTIAINNNPSAATLGGTKTANTSLGVATFTNLTINNIANGYTLSATSPSFGGRDPVTSAPFGIFGAATKLVFVVQPTTTMGGGTITPAIQVEVQDANGSTVTTATDAIYVALANNPGNAGTLSGTLSLNAVKGVATFGNLSVDKAATGYSLSAWASGLTGASSSAFNVIVGPGVKIGFIAQPSTTIAGCNISSQHGYPTAAVQDAGGNTVTTFNSGYIWLNIKQNPGTGTLSGGHGPISNGTVKFRNLTIDNPGIGYTLEPTSNLFPTGLPSVPFNINKLTFVQQPPESVTAGMPIPVQVAIQDANNVTLTGNTTQVIMQIGANPSGGTLSGTTTVTPVNGVATFDTISIDKVGTGYTLAAVPQSPLNLPVAASDPFAITPASPTHLGFVQQPQATIVAGQTFTPSIAVAAQDAFNNTVTWYTNFDVTIAASPSVDITNNTPTQTLKATAGVATFANLSIRKSGTYNFIVTSPNFNLAINSNVFIVQPGLAVQLAFVQQPANTIIKQYGNSFFALNVSVGVQDQYGNNLSGDTRDIKLQVGSNATSAKFVDSTGALQSEFHAAAGNVNTGSGVAVFSGFNLNKIGTYYLFASTSGGIYGSSSTFLVKPRLRPALYSVDMLHTDDPITFPKDKTRAYSINAAGIVAGSCRDDRKPIYWAASGNGISGTLLAMPAAEGTITYNGYVARAVDSYSTSVSTIYAAGYTSRGGSVCAARWSPLNASNGSALKLSSAVYTAATAYAMNPRITSTSSVVVGDLSAGGVFYQIKDPLTDGSMQALVYTTDASTKLTSPATLIEARGINDSLQIVGYSSTGAFILNKVNPTLELWDVNVFRTNVSNFQSHANGINADGVVAGADTSTTNINRMFAWTPVMTYLCDGSADRQALGINDYEEIAGFQFTGGNAAVLGTLNPDDTVIETVVLNNLISTTDRAKWNLKVANTINKDGKIAGYGDYTFPDPADPTKNVTVERAFRLTPTLYRPLVEFTGASSSATESTTTYSIPVILNPGRGQGASSDIITVDYSVTGGTASGNGVDYILANGTLTFQTNESIKFITVTIVNDTIQETDEIIQLSLTAPTNSSLGLKTTHTFTIMNDD
jgi:hypothetical protein